MLCDALLFYRPTIVHLVAAEMPSILAFCGFAANSEKPQDINDGTFLSRRSITGLHAFLLCPAGAESVSLVRLLLVLLPADKQPPPQHYA